MLIAAQLPISLLLTRDRERLSKQASALSNPLWRYQGTLLAMMNLGLAPFFLCRLTAVCHNVPRPSNWPSSPQALAKWHRCHGNLIVVPIKRHAGSVEVKMLTASEALPVEAKRLARFNNPWVFQ
jgi:hypothetical protein